jgi:uncharacterized protein with FMN-binding domain
MKKFLLSAAFIIAFGAYVTYNYMTSTTNAQQPVTVQASTGTSPASAVTFPTSSTTTAGGSVPPTSAPAQTPTPTPVAPKPVQTGMYVDGSYTGSVADAYYGNIQVEATISGGKLTDVTFLQYPNDRSTSREINQRAMTQLKAEAIQSQSATVDGVSGASDTSLAFEQSLASALSQAKA